jgi:PhnB protein
MPRNPPDGFHTLTPICLAADADGLVAFVEAALSGEVIRTFRDDGGRLAHAEVQIGDSMLMVGPASDEWPGFSAMLCVYVDHVDEAYALALAAGASSLRPPADQPYGDRSAAVVDSEGNQWWLTTRIEDLTREEIVERVSQEAAGGS